MDVIINNPPAAQTYQTQGVPSGYGPQMYGSKHHDGPPVGLIALLIGAFVLFRRRRPVCGQGDVLDDMRDTFRRGRDRFVNDQAQHIARERYARGEINADEYGTLKRNLGSERPDRRGGEGYRAVDTNDDLKV